MAFKIIVLATVLAACNAVPVWYSGNEDLPSVIMRIGRSPPSIAYGFGSGFSSNIDGITHTTSIGSSFKTGDAEAYGGGFGGADGGADGNVYARGIGAARTGNSYPAQYHPTYQNVPRTPYESAISFAQNSGNSGIAVSSAQSNGQFGSSVSSAQSGGPGRFSNAVSSAQNHYGYRTGFPSANTGPHGSAVSLANNDGYSSVSSAQTHGPGYNTAVAASQNNGGNGISTAQTAQNYAGNVQHSGATSYNGHDVQIAQSHAVNNRAQYY